MREQRKERPKNMKKKKIKQRDKKKWKKSEVPEEQKIYVK